MLPMPVWQTLWTMCKSKIGGKTYGSGMKTVKRGKREIVMWYSWCYILFIIMPHMFFINPNWFYSRWFVFVTINRDVIFVSGLWYLALTSMIVVFLTHWVYWYTHHFSPIICWEKDNEDIREYKLLIMLIIWLCMLR